MQFMFINTYIEKKAVLEPHYSLIVHWEGYMAILTFLANMYSWNWYNTKTKS